MYLQGGAVDSNMAVTGTAAQDAGITSIDAYIFPCISSTSQVFLFF